MKTKSNPAACPSAMAWDEYRLSANRADPALTRHLSACAACRKAFEDGSEMEAHFLTAVLPETLDQVVDAAAARAEWERRRRGPRLLPPRIFAAAALLLALGAGAVLGARRLLEPPAPYLAAKGALGLEVWCRRGDATFRVHQGDTLRPNDRIRLVPRFEAPALYVMVVSLDARGVVSRYHPSESDTAARVETSGEPLPGSTVLDDTPGGERLWLLAAEAPFSFDPIRAQIASAFEEIPDPGALAALPLAPTQQTLYFRKAAE